GLAYSKHTGVHTGFGEHFIKTGIVQQQFHTELIEAFELRHVGDYAIERTVTKAEADEQIRRAQEFLDLAARLIGSLPKPNKP
ncbi:MAG: HEPN domain-containing protein, partial [Nitrospiraceae bacterium]